MLESARSQAPPSDGTVPCGPDGAALWLGGALCHGVSPAAFPTSAAKGSLAHCSRESKENGQQKKENGNWLSSLPTHVHTTGSNYFKKKKNPWQIFNRQISFSVSWISKIFIWSLRFMAGPHILAGSAHTHTDLWSHVQFPTGIQKGLKAPTQLVQEYGLPRFQGTCTLSFSDVSLTRYIQIFLCTQFWFRYS